MELVKTGDPILDAHINAQRFVERAVGLAADASRLATPATARAFNNESLAHEEALEVKIERWRRIGRKEMLLKARPALVSLIVDAPNPNIEQRLIDLLGSLEALAAEA